LTAADAERVAVEFVDGLQVGHRLAVVTRGFRPVEGLRAGLLVELEDGLDFQGLAVGPARLDLTPIALDVQQDRGPRVGDRSPGPRPPGEVATGLLLPRPDQGAGRHDRPDESHGPGPRARGWRADDLWAHHHLARSKRVSPRESRGELRASTGVHHAPGPASS